MALLWLPSYGQKQSRGLPPSLSLCDTRHTHSVFNQVIGDPLAPHTIKYKLLFNWIFFFPEATSWHLQRKVIPLEEQNERNSTGENKSKQIQIRI